MISEEKKLFFPELYNRLGLNVLFGVSWEDDNDDDDYYLIQKNSAAMALN